MGQRQTCIKDCAFILGLSCQIWLHLSLPRSVPQEEPLQANSPRHPVLGTLGGHWQDMEELQGGKKG